MLENLNGVDWRDRERKLYTVDRHSYCSYSSRERGREAIDQNQKGKKNNNNDHHPHFILFRSSLRPVTRIQIESARIQIESAF
jgi:hypothetical protein